MAPSPPGMASPGGQNSEPTTEGGSSSSAKPAAAQLMGMLPESASAEPRPVRQIDGGGDGSHGWSSHLRTTLHISLGII